MTLFLCLDDNGGMMFGGKRQSRDRILISDMLSLCPEKLNITPYSETLIKDYSDKVSVNTDILSGGNWFIEDGRLIDDISGVSKIVIYKWNRVYPADVKFSFNPEEEGFELAEIYEFPGSSHENITRETYIRR